MKITAKTAANILEALVDHRGDYIEHCSDYGEPGYSLESEQMGIVFADWWRIGGKDYRDAGGQLVFGGRYPRIIEALNEFYVLEWSDEWMIAYPSDKCYRVQPDSYSWQCSVQYTDDGDPLTPEDSLEDWLEWALNEPTRCLPSAVFSAADLETAGFVQFPGDYRGDYSNGWYDRADDPKTIAEEALAHNPGAEFVFLLTGVGQFDMDFRCYVRAGD